MPGFLYVNIEIRIDVTPIIILAVVITLDIAIVSFPTSELVLIKKAIKESKNNCAIAEPRCGNEPFMHVANRKYI